MLISRVLLCERHQGLCKCKIFFIFKRCWDWQPPDGGVPPLPQSPSPALHCLTHSLLSVLRQPGLLSPFAGGRVQLGSWGVRGHSWHTHTGPAQAVQAPGAPGTSSPQHCQTKTTQKKDQARLLGLKYLSRFPKSKQQLPEKFVGQG